MAKELARYVPENGDEIVLTDTSVRNLISTNPNVSDKEMMLFAALCKAQRLNPYIKEAHLIKYGNNPATMVVGKDVFTKRAAKNTRFRGYEAGVSVLGVDGGFHRRAGSMVMGGESVVGGWCKVHLDGYEVPMFDEVSFEEYAGRKRDGELNQQWASKPGTMIRKVALVHALREAFPEDLQGLYESTEMGVEQVDEAPLEIYADVEDPLDTYCAQSEQEVMEAF